MTTPTPDPAEFDKAFQLLADHCDPKRPPGRQYEREAYPRRPKSDQFKKRNPQPLAEDASE